VIDLRGKVAVVTGGGRGIGAATALLLARAGADVAIGYRTRVAEAEAVAVRCREAGVHATTFAADLAAHGAADALMAHARAELGGVDLVVANAGVWPTEAVPVAAMSDARWLDTQAHNWTAMFQLSRAAARAVRDGGRLVFVSSTAGQRGEAFHADYAAAKGAMISLVKSLCVELAPRQVTVNCVAPGWVDTEAVAPVMVDGYRAQVERAIPLGRMASAEDIAGPIVFLCSDLARHCTGEVVNVNGGSVLCG
jgi:3-oxoacyl-[acyl-carrier protein] reductase